MQKKEKYNNKLRKFTFRINNKSKRLNKNIRFEQITKHQKI